MARTADQLPDDPDALKAMVLARDVENARLIQIIKKLQRHRFGRRAETPPEDQLLLGLEEAEQIEAPGMEDAEQHSSRRASGAHREASHEPRGAARPTSSRGDGRRHRRPCMPVLPQRPAPDRRRRERAARHCSGAAAVRRPKHVCRACEDVVVQAPAPAPLIEGGLPTEATVAQVLVSKYSDHLPLYRQAQIYARQGINLDRSTLADWVGRAAWHLRPVHERLLAGLKASPKLFADKTTAPVLDPAAARPRPGNSWPMPAMTGHGREPIRRASPMSIRRIERRSDRSLISWALVAYCKWTAMAVIACCPTRAA